jgi:hypothetical protein
VIGRVALVGGIVVLSVFGIAQTASADANDSANPWCSSSGQWEVSWAAMRQADTDNLEALKSVFPEVFDELKARYNATGGLLPSEVTQ